jgi:F-type H+-transporting ATPase subunit b
MHALMLSAAEKTVPLIDIDGTVFVQLGIFLLLMAVLYGLVFRPYLKVREERTKGIEGARGEAKTMDQRATEIVADYDARLLKAKQRGADERLKLRAEGVAHEQRTLAAAREATQKEIDAARTKAQAEQETARKALLAEANAVGKKIAGRLLGREV